MEHTSTEGCMQKDVSAFKSAGYDKCNYMQSF